MMRHAGMRAAGIVLLMAGFAAAGCSGGDKTGSTTQAHASRELRIVSFSPAISRTLVDFGLAGKIVGRTPFCSSLDPAVPVVGNLYEIDYERLLKLRPTHVLIQPPSSGVDARLLSLAKDNGWSVSQWTINSITDIERLILELPEALYANDSDAQAASARRAAELLNDIAASLSPRGDDLWRGRTLLVESVDSITVYGRDTYLDDVLTAMGGRNAVRSTGWAQLSLEDVVRLDPEAVILIRDSGPRDVNPLEAAGALAKLNIAAVRDGRLAVLAHKDADLPSSGIAGVADELRRVLRELAGKASQ